MLAGLLTNNKNKQQNTDYVTNNIKQTVNTISGINKYNNQTNNNIVQYPDCYNCISRSNKTIAGLNYVFRDGRCFKAVIPCYQYDCMNSILGGNWESNPESINAFSSCDPNFDTRYTGSSTRYIRIERGESILSVTLSFIEVYDLFGNYIQPIAAYAIPELSPHTGNNLLLRTTETYGMTKNEKDSYIQIDLGSNHDIFIIMIVPTIKYEKNLIGNNIVCINEKNEVTYKTTINYKQDIYVIQPGKKSLKSSFSNKEEEEVEVVKQPIHHYPSCIDNGCLDGDKYTIPLYQYMNDEPVATTDIQLMRPKDNRCYKAIGTSKPIFADKNVGIDILSKYFTTCDTEPDSFIKKIKGMYVILKSDKDIIEILEIEGFYNDEPMPFQYVVSSDTLNDADRIDDKEFDETYQTITSDSFIQCKYKTDTALTRIILSTPKQYSLLNKKLYFINSNNIILHNSDFTTAIIDSLPVVTETNVFKYTININGTGSKVNELMKVDNIYRYPSCIDAGCEVKGNPVIDSYYLFSDNKCFKSITDNCTNCLSDINNNIDNTSINKNFISCSNEFDTRTISIFGRYVIFKSSNLTGFDLKIIEIYNFKILHNIVNSHSFPIAIENGKFKYTQYAYDNNFSTYASVKNNTDDAEPYMLFDIGMNNVISSAKFDIKLTDPVIIYITDTDGVIIFKKTIYKSGSYVYSVNSTDPVSGSLIIKNRYNYPECIASGCDYKDRLIPGNQYTMTGKGTCLDVIKDDDACYPISDLYGTAMDNCFKSCSTDDDTRYPPSYGRFIRLTNNNTTDITITQLVGMDDSNAAYAIVNAFASVTSRTSSGNNLLSSSSVTLEPNSYVQIDLGENKTIYVVKVTANSSLNNTTIRVIQDNETISNITNITENSNTVLIRTKFNQPKNIKFSTFETFNYPACTIDATYKDCITNEGKSRERYTYRFPSKICAVSKLACSECLNSLNTETLNEDDVIRYFNSCSTEFDTRFASIRGRYIKIESTNDTGFYLAELKAYNKLLELDVIGTIGYPIVDTTSNKASNLIDGNNSTYAGVRNKIDTIVPFVMIDLGSDQTISSVNIIKKPGTSLSNTKLFIINNENVVVYSKTGDTITDGLLNVGVIYGLNDTTTINYTFNYPSCVDNGCTTDGKLFRNQFYNYDNKCYKSMVNDSSCIRRFGTMGSEMEACFNTCRTDYDTRYKTPVTAKYIRLTNRSGNEIKIAGIEILNSSNGIIPIYTTYAKGTTSAANGSNNLITGGNTIISGVNSYIQIDLENSADISKLKITTASDQTFTNLINVVLNVFSADFIKLFEYVIPSTLPTISNITNTIYVVENRHETGQLLFETHTYPGCPNNECIDPAGNTKPGHTYNISNNRCVKALTKYSIDRLIRNEITESEMKVNFDTCLLTETRYPPVTGRYVRIVRNTADTGFQIFSLEVYDSNNLKMSFANTRSFPQVENLYSTYLVDEAQITKVGPSKADASGQIVKPFIEIDLGADKVISFIRIIPTTPDTSLNDTILYVINGSGNTVFTQDINSISSTTSYFPIDIYRKTYSTINRINTFNYPDCKQDGCISDSKHIANQKYNIAPDKCVAAINNQLESACLGNYDNLDETAMNNCFTSCDSTRETRYGKLSVRFIRVISTTAGTRINISKILPFNEGTSVDIVNKHINGYVDYANRSDQLNTTSGSVSSTGYIQIDLGSDVNITNVNITPVLQLTNIEIMAINNAGRKMFSVIQTLNAGENIINIAKNIFTTIIINTVETFNYPECKSPFNDGVTDTFKPKLSFIYIMANNIRVKSINPVPRNDILDDVNNNTLTLTEMNTYFSSTSDAVDTRFPDALGKYLRIQSNSSTGFTLQGLTVTDGSGVAINITLDTVIKFIWPKTTTLYNTGNSPAGTPNPFVQFEFPTDIRFGMISFTSHASLNNCTIYVVHSDSSTKSQMAITAGKTSYRLMNIGGQVKNNIALSNRWSYPTCRSNGCVDTNDHYNNQMYEFDGGLRCYKTKNRQPITTCLDRVITSGTLTGSAMDACFDSCRDDMDTRYPTVSGRFIRIVKTSGTNNTKVSKITIFNDDVLVVIPPADKIGHTVGSVNGNLGYKIVDDDLTTYAEVAGLNSYIQLDLGQNYEMDKIKIDIPAGAVNPLTDTKLQVINQVGKVLYELPINPSLISTGINIFNNQSSSSGLINLNQEFTWPCAATDCVTPEGRSKPFFKYILPTTGSSVNRCMIAKSSKCSADNCVSSISDYSAPISLISTNFNSCDSYPTQVSYVSGKYIRIRKRGDDNPIIIKSLHVFNKIGLALTSATTNTYVKNVAENRYGKYMVDSDESTYTKTAKSLDTNGDNNYVQVELTENLEIGFIKIIADTTGITNTELVIANDAGVIQYNKTLAGAILDNLIILSNP
jgi:imidazoleglycerol phosphate dehydratase HisB